MRSGGYLIDGTVNKSINSAMLMGDVKKGASLAFYEDSSLLRRLLPGPPA
jgi:hypothetical protein